jgi:hypothetical protein
VGITNLRLRITKLSAGRQNPVSFVMRRGRFVMREASGVMQ